MVAWDLRRIMALLVSLGICVALWAFVGWVWTLKVTEAEEPDKRQGKISYIVRSGTPAFERGQHAALLDLPIESNPYVGINLVSKGINGTLLAEQFFDGYLSIMTERRDKSGKP